MSTDNVNLNFGRQNNVTAIGILLLYPLCNFVLIKEVEMLKLMSTLINVILLQSKPTKNCLSYCSYIKQDLIDILQINLYKTCIEQAFVIKNFTANGSIIKKLLIAEALGKAEQSIQLSKHRYKPIRTLHSQSLPPNVGSNYIRLGRLRPRRNHLCS